MNFTETNSTLQKSEINENLQPIQEEIEQINERLMNSAPLTSKDAYAIVIGISDYPGTENDLSYCDDDAQAVYSMLVNEYNFKTENILYLQDSSATLNGINNAFDTIASQITSDDIFFFYYSGHGGTSLINEGIHLYSIDSPHPYINNYDHTWSIYHPNAAYMRVYFDHLETESNYDWVYLGDTDIVDGWIYEGYSGYSTGFWSGWIPLLSDNRLYIRFISDYTITDWGFSIDRYEVLTYSDTNYLCSYDSIPDTPANYYLDTFLDSKLDLLACAEKYVVLDACNSGGMIPEVQEVGRYIMTACEAEEFSLESSSLNHGVFTNFFLDSYNYATDTNSDGVKSMEECYSYTYSNTVSFSSSIGYTHHPQQYDGISGEAVLATTFGSVSLDPAGNTLLYSFNIYGTGLIQELYIALCHVSTEANFSSIDLTLNAPTNTGFGSYSGTVQLDGVSSLTGFGLFAKIEGNRMINLSASVSEDFDGDTLDDLEEIMNGLNPLTADSDSDGLDDAIEFYGITDPLNNDTDEDGMDDGYEVNNNLDPLNDDTGGDLDGDGLSNLSEYYLGTFANNNDTDNDDLSDGDEISTYLTDPTNGDTDGDGLSDGLEILNYNTDPLNDDSDGDGMSDGFEINYGFNNSINDSFLDNDDDGLTNLLEFQYNCNPFLPDTDGDGIIDGIEVFDYNTDPSNQDTEGDGMDDYFEIIFNLDPLVNDSDLDNDDDGLINLLECQCGTSPLLADSDGDFMIDLYEYNCNLNPLINDANLDEDQDGLDNLLEFLLGSIANNVDSDNDNMPDYWEYSNDLNLISNDANLDSDSDGLTNYIEYNNQLNPQNPDSDNDGLSDGDELLIYNTDPLNQDTDGDGYSDGVEILWGTDPLNSKISLNTYFYNIAGILILASSTFYIGRTQLTKRKQNKLIARDKISKLETSDKTKIYNAVKVEKKTKPKPPKPLYQQRTSSPTYADINTIKDIVLNRLPPPNSNYSEDGKRALLIANMAFNFLNQGRYKESYEYMINALILGVPEPMNSRIKSIILDSLDRSSSPSGSTHEEPSTHKDSLEFKKCIWCGKLNKRSYNNCINCGRSLKQL